MADDQPADFSSPVKALQAVYDREVETTGHIRDLYNMAVKENDYGTQQFLDWFADEQIEEERTSWELLSMLKLIGDDRAALALYDKGLQD
jgi:ferritin